MAKTPSTRRAIRPKKQRDIALIVGRTEDNQGFQVLRKRGDDSPPELGEIHPLKEGKPISGDVVSLTPRADFPFAFDVKTEVAADEPAQGSGTVPEARRLTNDGPAQVASPAYRKGWELIYGTKMGGVDRLN